jgi:hypothetical protein
MSRIFRFLWIQLLLYGVIAAPMTSITSDLSVPRPPQPPEPVTPSSFGHLGINLGLGAVGVLVGIAGAECALHIIQMHKKGRIQRMQNDAVRRNQGVAAKEAEEREEEALQLLLDMADRHAQTVSSEGFKKKFEPFQVPKEIHQSLERIFQKKENGVCNVETYLRLKEILSPLLSFE